MSHVKAGGTAKNVKDSPGQRLGVKIYGGQKVRSGQVIVRQVGATKRAGKGTKLSRNFTIHANTDGVVTYKTRRVRLFTGKSVKRVEVTIEPHAAATAAKQETAKAPATTKATKTAPKATKTSTKSAGKPATKKPATKANAE